MRCQGALATTEIFENIQTTKSRGMTTMENFIQRLNYSQQPEKTVASGNY